MQTTRQDTSLQECLSDKVAALRKLIAQGKPYVWLLGINQTEFDSLELLLTESISSHNGSHSHLVAPEFALHLVIYTADYSYHNDETEQHQRDLMKEGQ